MSCCAPACAVPSCSPPVCYPVGGLGGLSSCGAGPYGIGSPAASLGIAPGATVGCLCQAPPSEILIQPAPVCVVVPGAIIAPSCEPVRVGGYTACASGSSGGSSRLRYFPCSPCSPCK